jgi:folate-binding protein YgfZ
VSDWVTLLPRDLVVVAGSDALSYLQSLISQDIDVLGDGDGAHSLLLTPQGKLDVDLVLLREGDTAWLVCERGFGERLKASLERFKIRVDVQIEQRDDTAHVGVRGGTVPELARRAGLDAPDHTYSHREWGDGRVVRVPWPEGDGVDVVGPAATVDRALHLLEEAGAPLVGEREYEAARIEAGVPRQGVDFDEKTIPQEAFLEREAVSFTKGCFLGQELVCRIDTRGHVNRYLRILRDIEGGRPVRGAEILEGDRVVGAVTSTVDSEELLPAALGYVRRELEPPVEVVIRWNGHEARAIADVLPSAR